MKNIEETKNCFSEQIQQNKLLSKNHKKISTTLNDIEHLLILASAVTACISISAFASLLGILIEITSSAMRLKIYGIIAGIKKYKSIIKKKKRSMIKWYC